MAACEKIYLDNEQEVNDFKRWLSTAPKKTKKLLKKHSYTYASHESIHNKPWGKIYMNDKLSKSLCRCNLPWLKAKAWDQAEALDAINDLFLEMGISLDNC